MSKLIKPDNSGKVKSDSAVEDPKPLDTGKSDLKSDSKSDSVFDLNKVAVDIANPAAKEVAHADKVDDHKDTHDHHTTSKHDKHKFHGKTGKTDHEHHGFRKPDTTNKVDVQPDKLVNEPLGTVFTPRADRAKNEYTEVDSKGLFTLGLTSAVQGLDWQLFTNLAQIRRSFNYSTNITLNRELNRAVETINTVSWSINPFNFGMGKDMDAALAQGWVTPRQRKLELNCSIINYVLDRDDVDTAPIQWRTPGAINSMYPHSSEPGNPTGLMPLTPAQVDDIMLFSLDGGAFLKGTNRLYPTPIPRDQTWTDTNRCYALPGFCGFNHYPFNALSGTGSNSISNAQNDGELLPHMYDAGLVADRQFIYAGDSFTSNGRASNDVTGLGDAIADGLGLADATNRYIMHFRTNHTDDWGAAFQGGSIIHDLENIHRPVNVEVNPENPSTYPDYNYSVIQNDYNKLYKAYLDHYLLAIPATLNGQTAGMRNEQAFYYAVQSGIHLGTFLRCLLYSISKTWGYNAFVKAKVGQLCYNDMLPRTVNKATFMKMWAPFEYMQKSVLPYIPYNKYSFDNFKIWFDASMTSSSKNTFDENNPVMSVRAVFCGIQDIMQMAVLPHGTAAEIERNYFPQQYHATGITSTIEYFMHGHVDNVWGYFVKSNIMQEPMFVPHGDALANFFTYFGGLFMYRPWTNHSTIFNDIHGIANAFANNSLTPMLDPLNFTGFAANFFSHVNVGTELVRWLKAYVTIVQPWYNFVRSISDNSATIHFDDNVEFSTPDFAYNSILEPGYKQHIVDYFQNTPRLFYANTANHNNTLDATLTAHLNPANLIAIIAGHTAHLGWAAPRDPLLNVNNLAAYSTPRVGLPLIRSDSLLDSGTFGMMMYNISEPWATSARHWHTDLLGDVAQELDGHIDNQLQADLSDNVDRAFYCAADIRRGPVDLYDWFWYPSMWHMPFYFRGANVITPAYEYYVITHTNDALTTHANPTDYANHAAAQVTDFQAAVDRIGNFRDYSYAYPDLSLITEAVPIVEPDRRNYRELFFGISDAAEDNNFLCAPASSCIRLTYGSGNTNLVNNDQYVIPSIGNAATAHDVLATRANTISIFTAYNARAIGLSTTRRNIEYSYDGQGRRLYREIITDNLCKSLGLAYVPFLYASTGASLYFDQVLNCIPSFKYRLMTTDYDLSLKFSNLYQNISRMGMGLFDGECYPSSDGYGTDQITHPEKLNEAKASIEHNDRALEINAKKMNS